MMKRRRLLITGVLLLLGGAIVNVAVAWGCATWSPITEFEEIAIDENDLQWLSANDEQAKFDGSVGNVTGKDYYSKSLSGGWGVTWIAIDLHSDELLASQRRFYEQHQDNLISVYWASYQATRFSSGLPLRSMWSEYWRHTPEWESSHHDGTSALGGWLLAAKSDPFYKRVLSWQPIWPGFAINTIFYAAILWVAFFVPGMVRRRIRRRRGRCPACAYPIGTSPVCTECGAAIAGGRSEGAKECSHG